MIAMNQQFCTQGKNVMKHHMCLYYSSACLGYVSKAELFQKNDQRQITYFDDVAVCSLRSWNWKHSARGTPTLHKPLTMRRKKTKWKRNSTREVPQVQLFCNASMNPQSKLIFLVQFRPYRNTRHLNTHHLILATLRWSCTSMLLSDASYHLPTVEYVTMVIWPQSYFVPCPVDLMISSSAAWVGDAKYGPRWCCLHMDMMLTNFYKNQAPIPHLKNN